jgi:putative RNA 2'-phosphotransferase
MASTDTDVSKYLSYILRHNPADAGLILDENGWTAFDSVADAINKKFQLEASDVVRIIEENPKKRFTIDGKRVRAAQGHSVEVELDLAKSIPPPILYHGTTETAWLAIRTEGLKAMDRNHVHLSADTVTAITVAKRRQGPPILLQINAAMMQSQGRAFYLSDNNVWLCESVPSKYIKPVTETLP